MKDLSILIPSRCEMFLKKTIEDILSNIEMDTEIIAVLDGAWAEPAVPQHERVTIVYLPESIGQRAATNLACKLAKGKYVIKCDAHCAFDKGFDRKMIEAFKETGDNVTMIPIMRNLHAFNWKCPDGHTRYQGPSGPCVDCGKPTERDVVWIPKTNPQSKAYCFDSEPHFQYFGEYTKTKKYKKDLAETGLTESMSIQGSFFMLTREKYWELNICDESWGSWGTQGAEIAAKTWLSGGKVMVNHNSWYAHLFRTTGGDFSFPYPQSGNQVQNAKKCFRDLFYENKWSKQIYSLSWLIERFSPVRGWGEKELARIKRFDLPSHSSTLVATPSSSNGVRSSKLMPPVAKNLSSVDSSRSVTPKNISSGKNQKKVGGITTTGDVAEVVKNLDILPLTDGNGLDKPSINESMNVDGLVVKTGIPMSTVIDTTSPQPATSFTEVNMRENLGGFVGANIGNDKKVIHDVSIPSSQEKSKTFGVCYISDCRLDPVFLKKCQDKLRASFKGKIVSVTLKPTDFGENVVMDIPREKLSIFKQILKACETLDTDYVFLCDDDCLYPPEHFDFTPPRDDTFYYDLNWWRVRSTDGFAVHFDAKQSNLLCANRLLLVDEYKSRVDFIEKNGWQHIGYEPGTRSIRRGGLNDRPSGTYFAKEPSIDIRHGKNLTGDKWKKEDFRDPRYSVGWNERYNKSWLETNYNLNSS